MNRLAPVLLITVLLASIILVHSTVDAKSSKDKKARDAIVKAMGKAVEGHYAQIDIASLSKFNDNTSIVFYNKTGGTVTPPPPNPTPTPEPTPIPSPTSGFKLCMAGDFKDSSVFDAMKKNGCNFRIALGDMGYSSSLSLVKSIAPDKCVIGNHDAPEDGSSAIYKEALAYCGDSWWLTLGNKTLILGFNTNGNIGQQLQAASAVIAENAGVKNIIALSHKNGHVFPSANHPAEAKSLYSQLESMIPSNVKLYEVSGHNHDLAAASNGLWFISGAGGKSHYACGTSSEWNFCDNSHYGFLQFTIDNQGTITPNFIDTSGKVIH